MKRKLLEMVSKTNFSKFSGDWVAVKNNQVISNSRSIKVVLKNTKDEPIEKVIILKVPKKNQMMIL